MGLWPLYKPSFNPIGQVAVEIQPHFQSGRGRGLVDMAKTRHRVNRVMAAIETKFQPNRPSGRRDTTPLSNGCQTTLNDLIRLSNDLIRLSNNFKRLNPVVK